MKNIAIFTSLKIAEISAIIFIPYLLGVLDKNTVQWPYSEWQEPLSIFGIWFNGFFYILSLGGVFMGIVLIVVAIKANWELAKKLNKNKGG